MDYFSSYSTIELILTGLFFLCTLFNVGFALKVILAFSLYRDKGGEPQPVSVVVAAHYQLENLRRLVPALLSQNHPDFEVIIVDDRTHDETYDYLLEQKQKDERLRHVRIESVPHHANAKKYALTLGIKAATKPNILLTDADCYPATSDWVAKMSARFSANNQFVLGFSQYSSGNSFLSYFIRYETLITGMQYLSAALLKSPYMGVGRNLGYRKAFFIENNGFGSLLKILGGDDDLLVNRYARSKNTAVAIGKDELIYSIPKQNWHDYFVQKKRHMSVGKLYRFTDKLKIGFRMLNWFGFYLFLLLALVWGINTYIILGVFLTRTIFWYIAVWVSSRKTGDRFSILPVLFIDIAYLFYYFATGLTVLFSKKIKWA